LSISVSHNGFYRGKKVSRPRPSNNISRQRFRDLIFIAVGARVLPVARALVGKRREFERSGQRFNLRAVAS